MWHDLETVGLDRDTGGYHRFAWSRTDHDLREWFAGECAARGLDLTTDRMGNQWAWWGDPDAAVAVGDPGIVIGSHLDSVPDGGAFDGPLGVVSAFAALDALGAGAVAIVSPYVASVAEPIRAAFETRGFAVPAALSFGEQIEARVARIDPTSIRDAALRIGTTAGVDAVFLSCTNLRTLDIIDELEQRLGVPVLSSNQVLAWHMARLAQAPVSPSAPGRLFRL